MPGCTARLRAHRPSKLGAKLEGKLSRWPQGLRKKLVPGMKKGPWTAASRFGPQLGDVRSAAWRYTLELVATDKAGAVISRDRKK